MPQMAPLNWLSLMIMFIMILILFNILNYYSFSSIKKSLKQKQFKTPMTNWKW
uniref:ATP synthase F0 subunit 8 n=1 Tax=Melanesthes exilidentata TaxID=3037597 RepID=UPI002434EEF2|nr:ATP synthase F0 subunit 8 [Melanesthes exilidentata]WEX49709.1 ATP synthase F0 subunit 8 [Melanesthes exilidentata]